MMVKFYLDDIDGVRDEQVEVLPEGYDTDELIEGLMFTWLESKSNYNDGFWEEYGWEKQT